MDEDLLCTCSSEVEKALRYLEDHINSEEDYSVYNSAAFYALDRVGSDEAKKFLERYHVSERLDILPSEFSDRLPFLAKLANKYLEDAWSPDIDQSPNLNYFSQRLKSVQMSKGDFSLGDYNPSGPIWFLVQHDSSANSVRKAIKHFVSMFPRDRERIYSHELANAAIGVIAVSEVSPDTYRQELEDITDWIAESINQLLDEKSDIYYPTLGYYLMALVSSPGDYSETTNRLAEKLISEQSDEGYWGKAPEEISESNGSHRTTNLHLTGVVTTALIYAGYGPKIPAMEVEAMLEKKTREYDKSKPKFVTTVPSTRHEERNTDILNYAGKLISETDEILRISTLRIDMLYEEIIDKIHEDSLEVRILTNTGKTSGSRSKLKVAAMNELNRRSEGNVKEDDLIHTRFVISDNEALLVSSADLTREQLHEEFNAGVFTRDSEAVGSAIELFDNMWEEADHRGQQ
ncbi:PLD-like domain-containing protein [Halogranum gelatinilyticum]|uniref:PLD-like domain-containing protein n=1 Tax=Halogranum gelatinilyticum TaxID=660521 RepID=A0A1G9PZJ7_9EURY|nr:phospholipase D-like domain-containing protein [Halogranum gelatinilyticum]SDM03657.1 PLD-like domain-containing protein [Halogranum gelatinilyticum]